MFAVAASVLCFYFNAVGFWLPVTSYVVAAILPSVVLHKGPLAKQPKSDTLDGGAKICQVKPKRYIVRLRNGSERVVVANSYIADEAQDAYIFVGDDNAEDQFLPLASVEWILLSPEQSEHDKVHDEIHREHSLLSNRMNWYVTSQSFLVGAFAMGGEANYTFRWMSRWFIPSVGILITVATMLSMFAGVRAMIHLRNLSCYKCDCFNAPPYLHRVGVGASCMIPVILLLGWIGALYMARLTL